MQAEQQAKDKLTESSLVRRSCSVSRAGRSASPDCTAVRGRGPCALIPKRCDTEAGWLLPCSAVLVSSGSLQATPGGGVNSCTGSQADQPAVL